MSLLQVDVYSHNFAVSNIAPRVKHLVDTFARRYVQYGVVKSEGRWIRQAIKIFASATKDRSIYRFHINQYKDFSEHLKIHDLVDEAVTIIIHETPLGARAHLPVFERWQVREEQAPVIEYIVKPGEPRTRFVALQTGKGKSFCFMKGASEIGHRILGVVRAQFLLKWQADMMKTYDIDVEDIMVIQGSSSLKQLIDDAQNGDLEAKAILISNRTYQEWIKLYEQFQEGTRDLGYGCLPQEFCEVLKVGVRLIDEVHLDFHFNFKLDTYTHVEKTVSLSATLITDDPFLQRMYNLAYPPLERYQGPAYDKYVKVTAILYRLNQPKLIKYKDYARQSYSHNLFEQSLMRQRGMHRAYMDLIVQCLKTYYLGEYRAGDRALVFGASIAFCTSLALYLASKFPDKKVCRYVDDDPYDNLLTPDICVSTLLSAGTGHDIENLTTVILSTAIQSSQSNVQGIGRLRKLNHTTPRFIYLSCEDIPKHMEYHSRKAELLKERAAHFKIEYVHRPLQ